MTKETGGAAFPGNGEIFIEGPQGLGPQSAWGMQGSPGMTLRQYAAVKLKVPDSGTDWLDDMVTKSLRDDFAAKAMAGYLTGDALLKDADTADEWLTKTAKAAYEMADKMLKARQE